MSPTTKTWNNNPNGNPSSSFPGIWKYPTGFGVPFRTADDWIAGKKQDDDIGSFWRVHDKIYDLTSFIPNHPGGSEWIQITQGTDITEAFETSHVVNSNLVEGTLAKYYVADAKQPRVSPYTFETQGFYMTLKRRVEPIFKKVGSAPTRQALFIQDSLVATFIILGIVGTVISSNVLKVLSGFILACMLVSAHNFIHLKDNWRKYYYDLGLFSSYEWMITHILSHHLYPNTLMDIELQLFPTYQFLPNRPKNWLQKYGPPVYSHFIYLIGLWCDFGKRIYNLIKGRQKFRLENAIVLIELALLVLIAPTMKDGFWSWILIHTVSSYLLLTHGAAAAHHHPEIFHDGDEPRPNPDFGLCQLDATRDRAGEYRKNLFMVLITLGEHSLHHLFPTICHSKLHYIKPVFEQTLKDFSEEHPLLFQWELYLGCFRQLARTEIRKFSQKTL